MTSGMFGLPSGMTQQQLISTFRKYLEAKERQKTRRFLPREKLGWALRGEIEKFGSLGEAVKWMKRAEVLKELSREDPGLREGLEGLMEEEEEEKEEDG